MTYDYACDKCRTIFQLERRMGHAKPHEPCPNCKDEGRRLYSANIYLNGTKVTHPEYNPAFGCVVKNKRHKEDLAKAMNVHEVGNDFGSGDKMGKHFDKVREDRRRKVWDDI